MSSTRSSIEILRIKSSVLPLSFSCRSRACIPWVMTSSFNYKRAFLFTPPWDAPCICEPWSTVEEVGTRALSSTYFMPLAFAFSSLFCSFSANFTIRSASLFSFALKIFFSRASFFLSLVSLLAMALLFYQSVSPVNSSTSKSMAPSPSNDFRNSTFDGGVWMMWHSKYHPPLLRGAVVNVCSWFVVYMQSAEERSRKVDKKGRRSVAEIAPFGRSSNLKYLEVNGHNLLHT